MSSGAECSFKEVSPGRWTYWLQDYPYGETEDGATYGPFPTFARAYAHLNENHQNPGGYSANCLPEGQHVHEWTTGDAHRPVGVEVSIRVDSLGPDPDPAALMALIKALPDDHPAWRTRKAYGFVPNITKCEACGRDKQGA